MKALTLTQPWAELVRLGDKRVETRSWSTPHRGPLLIHAAKGWTADDRDYAVSIGFDTDLTRGAIVAVGRLVDVRSTNGRLDISDRERELGDYSPGRFAWFLEDVIALEPIPWRGALGLWDGPDLAPPPDPRP